jgi:DNA transformation protein
MSHADSQVAHLLDLLEPLGGVTARSMFGEYGFFRDGAMLACIYQGAFYVRVDAETRTLHEARGLPAFVYEGKSGRRVTMPYYQVPPEAFEDSAEMLRWAAPAARAAAAAKQAKPSARKPAPKPPTKTARKSTTRKGR